MKDGDLTQTEEQDMQLLMSLKDSGLLQPPDYERTAAPRRHPISGCFAVRPTDPGVTPAPAPVRPKTV